MRNKIIAATVAVLLSLGLTATTAAPADAGTSSHVVKAQSRSNGL